MILPTKTAEVRWPMAAAAATAITAVAAAAVMAVPEVSAEIRLPDLLRYTFSRRKSAGSEEKLLIIPDSGIKYFLAAEVVPATRSIRIVPTVETAEVS